MISIIFSYNFAGWDGCRNRDDGNPLLNQELQYIKPYARSGVIHCVHFLTSISDHSGVFVPSTGEILIYGGKAYLAEEPKSHQITWPYKVAHDMWYYNFNHCVNNCSNHGVCKLGFCYVCFPLFSNHFCCSVMSAIMALIVPTYLVLELSVTMMMIVMSKFALMPVRQGIITQMKMCIFPISERLIIPLSFSILLRPLAQRIFLVKAMVCVMAMAIPTVPHPFSQRIAQ